MPYALRRLGFWDILLSCKGSIGSGSGLGFGVEGGCGLVGGSASRSRSGLLLLLWGPSRKSGSCSNSSSRKSYNTTLLLILKILRDLNVL